jgi:hypothetical protein
LADRPPLGLRREPEAVDAIMGISFNAPSIGIDNLQMSCMYDVIIIKNNIQYLLIYTIY